MTMCCRQMTLDDLLNDPVTQAVMQADHVDSNSLRAMLGSLAVDIGNVAPKTITKKNESACAGFNRSAATPSHHPATHRQSRLPAIAAAGSGIRLYLCGAR
jgi:hypothetical protein